jgi:hypothetical protein
MSILLNYVDSVLVMTPAYKNMLVKEIWKTSYVIERRADLTKTPYRACTGVDLSKMRGLILGAHLRSIISLFGIVALQPRIVPPFRAQPLDHSCTLRCTTSVEMSWADSRPDPGLEFIRLQTPLALDPDNVSFLSFSPT